MGFIFTLSLNYVAHITHPMSESEIAFHVKSLWSVSLQYCKLLFHLINCLMSVFFHE